MEIASISYFFYYKRSINTIAPNTSYRLNLILKNWIATKFGDFAQIIPQISGFEPLLSLPVAHQEVKS